ncbi:MAG: ECF transporter S component [Chloroflexi bacterium]|mgnify:CR=1 FL=1|nr:ECF transporter S component [Chloroflexota bacterium]
MEQQERSIRRIVTAGMLLAVTLLLALTPVGFIPVPTPAGSATIAHIPAIIGGILEGPLVGLIVSLGFGFASFLSPLVPVKDPFVIILPRLLIGVAAAWVYYGLRRARRPALTAVLLVLAVAVLAAAYVVSQSVLWLGIAIAVLALSAAGFGVWWLGRGDTAAVGLAAAAITGSLANTVLVLGAAVVRQVAGITPEVALSIGFMQGIPEAVVSAIIVVAVVSAIRQVGRNRSKL